MASPTEISELLNNITGDLRTIIADEIALVRAEIKPTVRRIGVGSGMFAGAAYFAISALTVLWFTIAAGFAWLYASVTSLSPWASVFFGTLAAVFVMLIVAVVFIVLGGKSFSKIKAPEKAPESLGKSITAFATGLENGGRRITAELQGDREQWISLEDAPAVPRVPVGGSVLVD